MNVKDDKTVKSYDRSFLLRRNINPILSHCQRVVINTTTNKPYAFKRSLVACFPLKCLMKKLQRKISCGFEDFGINKLQSRSPRALSFLALIVLVSSLAAKYFAK